MATGLRGVWPERLAWREREAAQAAAYDSIGDHYDEAFPHKEGQLDAVAELTRRLPPGARVLDAGCGTGLPTARQLVDAGCSLTCVDISTEMLRICESNVPEAEFRLADIVDLEPAPAEYDAIVAFFSLLNLPKSRVAETLRRFEQMLRPTGWLAIGMVEGAIDDILIPFLGSRIKVSGYPRDELRAEVRAAGFVIEHEDVRNYAPATSQAPPEVQLFLTCRPARGSGEDTRGETAEKHAE